MEEFAAGADLGMARDDLLDEGRAGPRHADDHLSKERFGEDLTIG